MSRILKAGEGKAPREYKQYEKRHTGMDTHTAVAEKQIVAGTEGAWGQGLGIRFCVLRVPLPSSVEPLGGTEHKCQPHFAAAHGERCYLATQHRWEERWERTQKSICLALILAHPCF